MTSPFTHSIVQYKMKLGKSTMKIPINRCSILSICRRNKSVLFQSKFIFQFDPVTPNLSYGIPSNRDISFHKKEVQLHIHNLARVSFQLHQYMMTRHTMNVWPACDVNVSRGHLFVCEFVTDLPSEKTLKRYWCAQ